LVRSVLGGYGLDGQSFAVIRTPLGLQVGSRPSDDDED
jgi:hypothetical protein